MDAKKVIEKLVSIAYKQQQIINKLAQAQTPPGELVKQSLPPALQTYISVIEARGDTLYVHLLPGHDDPNHAQHTLDVVIRTVQNLLNQNKLLFPYKVQKG